MNHPPSLAQPRTVRSGHPLVLAGESAPVWRVKSGVFFLQRPCLDGHLGAQLALPGDLIGLEAMAQQVHAFTAVALLDASVEAVPLNDSARLHAALLEALLQQQRQMLDVAQLRSGPIAQRLKHLLVLLARRPEGGLKALERGDLPTLRDMAQIVDSALETVCRELNVLLPRGRTSPKRATPRTATRWVPAVHFPMGLAA
jgi:CRP-like cAMP-binding protein